MVAAMLLIMAKLSVILRSDFENTYEFQHSLGRVKCVDNSAIKEHLLFCNLAPDFEDFSIQDTNNKNFKVALMDSLLINKDHHLLNKYK